MNQPVQQRECELAMNSVGRSIDQLREAMQAEAKEQREWQNETTSQLGTLGSSIKAHLAYHEGREKAKANGHQNTGTTMKVVGTILKILTVVAGASVWIAIALQGGQ